MDIVTKWEMLSLICHEDNSCDFITRYDLQQMPMEFLMDLRYTPFTLFGYDVFWLSRLMIMDPLTSSWDDTHWFGSLCGGFPWYLVPSSWLRLMLR
jgi:hypothetical protein